MSVITVVLADDHSLVRQSLRLYLETEADISVVGEASDGLEACALVQQLHPDLLIVDVSMPGLGGLEVTHQVTRKSPQTRVIVLSMYSNEAYVVQALRSGAAGYVLKESSGAELLLAVNEVMAGRRYLSSPLSERAIDHYIRTADSSPFDSYETLTNREREVLELVYGGNSNSEIGKLLEISPRTAETHRTNMMQKLGIHSLKEVIAYSAQRGIISGSE